MGDWIITFGDKSWSAEDLTLAHLAYICEGLRRDTWEIDPAIGPCHLSYVLAAFIAVDQNLDYMGVVRLLRPLPALALRSMLTTD